MKHGMFNSVGEALSICLGWFSMAVAAGIILYGIGYGIWHLITLILNAMF